MRFSDADLRHLESLAMIDLDGESRERLRLQLPRIIEMVRYMEKIETGDDPAEPAGISSGPGSAEDVPSAGLEREEILAQAPDTHEGFFRVPPVIDGE